MNKDLDKGRECSFFSVRLLIRVNPELPFTFSKLYNKAEV